MNIRPRAHVRGVRVYVCTCACLLCTHVHVGLCERLCLSFVRMHLCSSHVSACVAVYVCVFASCVCVCAAHTCVCVWVLRVFVQQTELRVPDSPPQLPCWGRRRPISQMRKRSPRKG